MSISLYPHQKKAIREMKNGCILKGGTGVGKSYTAIAYFYFKVCGGKMSLDGRGSYSPPKTPMDLYIITTAKKRDDGDWLKECASFAISSSRDGSVGGIGLVVDSWNNIKRYIDVSNAFFIFDEQRLVGSGAWAKAFLKISEKNQWIVLSATPGDSWIDYASIFVANGFFKNRTEFIRNHVVYRPFTTFPQIQKYVGEGYLLKLRSKILVDMPYLRHTVRHKHQVFLQHDQKLLDRVIKDRWHIFEDRPLYDVSEMFRVMRKLVNSDESRRKKVVEIHGNHPRLIIFYNFDYELAILRQTCSDAGINYAEWNGNKHESLPESDSWVYLVQYVAGAEGWNCITTDAMLFYSLNYSYKVFEQAQGRIDRINTPYTDLHYYIFRSNTPIDRAIWRTLARKKDFNEREFIKETAVIG